MSQSVSERTSERANQHPTSIACVTRLIHLERGVRGDRGRKVGDSFREDWTAGRARVASAVVGRDRILVSPAAA